MKFATRMWWPLLLLVMAAWLNGCAATLDDYHNDKPLLRLQDYFSGRIKAYGLFQDVHGKVIRRFTVDLNGRWQDNIGTLEEDFIFDDGERQRRVWTITDYGDGHYRGRAGDVVGEAVGEAKGNALRWRYTLRLPLDGDDYDFQFDDWLWQFDEKRMFNKAEMKKFGIVVGEITIYFEKI